MFSRRIQQASTFLLSSTFIYLSSCATLLGEPHPSNLTIKLGNILHKNLAETSGLALHNKQLWTINDSGNAPSVYQLNLAGELQQQYRIRGVKNKNWESLAADQNFLYIADCGNNSGKRNTLQIYKVDWQDINQNKAITAAQTINFSYSDKTANGSKHHNFDCEAISVVNNELWLFTKNRGNSQTTLYKLNPQLDQQVLSPITSYPVNGLITAADYNSATQQLALLGYENTKPWGQSFLWLIPVINNTPVFTQAKQHWLSPLGQWEAIQWINDTQVVLTSEKNPFLKQPIGTITLEP